MRLEETWAEFASEIGAEFSSGESSRGDTKVGNFHIAVESEVIASNFKGWPISLKYREDTAFVRRGSKGGDYDRPQSVDKVMVMTAYHQGRDQRGDDFWFSIQRKNIFHRLSEFIGHRGLILGYPDIDRNFKVLSNDLPKIQALFAKNRIPQLLRYLPTTTLKRTAPTLMGALLSLTTKRPIIDIDQLRGLFEFFAEILDGLHEIGLAERLEVPLPPQRPKLKVGRPKTKTASSESRRLKLFENWLEYLCFRSATSVMFEGNKGGLVQFSYSSGSKTVCIEVVTNLWEDISDEVLSERVIEQLNQKGFNSPETIDSRNYWQVFNEEELRSVAMLAEWAFREVFRESTDYTVKMTDFV